MNWLPLVGRGKRKTVVKDEVNQIDTFGLHGADICIRFFANKKNKPRPERAEGFRSIDGN